MKTIQAYSDKLAISLSFLCMLHCLALPALLIMVPSMTALQLDNEAFHLVMLIGVIPISLYALSVGCQLHQRYRLLAMGGVGLLFLIGAVTFGEAFFGESGEKILTLIGSLIIILGHYWNFRLCQKNRLSEESRLFEENQLCQQVDSEKSRKSSSCCPSHSH